MAGKYKKRKLNKKKKDDYQVYTKKFNGLTICKVPSVCPDIMEVQLVYNRTASFGAASPVVQVFRGNSIYDPDFSGAGTQPMGHDQWATLYRRYRVLASKCQVITASTDATDTNGCVVVPLNTSAASTIAGEYVEAAYASVGKISRSGDNTSQKVTNYITTSKIRGIPSDGVMYEEDLGASFGANPTRDWYWHVCWYDGAGGINAISGTASIRVTYYVQCYDRQTLTSS